MDALLAIIKEAIDRKDTTTTEIDEDIWLYSFTSEESLLQYVAKNLQLKVGDIITVANGKKHVILALPKKPFAHFLVSEQQEIDIEHETLNKHWVTGHFQTSDLPFFAVNQGIGVAVCQPEYVNSLVKAFENDESQNQNLGEVDHDKAQ